MANYNATVISEGGKIKKGSESKIKDIISKYNFGSEDGLTVAVEGSELNIYGYDGMYAYELTDEDYENECFEDFLKEVSSHLITPLIVKETGNEKCRYSVAYAFVVNKGKVKCISLDAEIRKFLKKK